MNWKHNLVWSCLLTFGLAAAGCGSGSVAESTKSATASSPSTVSEKAAVNEGASTTDAADLTLVKLDLPGMT